jgi:hypothetical protein
VSTVADQVVSLSIRFGNQIRYKCAVCTRYLRPGCLGEAIACTCGSVWLRTKADDGFVLLGTDTP